MKRLNVLLACFLLATLPLAAQKVPKSELEFVEKMRAQGYADYARDHVLNLQKQYPGDTDLELELINSQLALAEQAPEAAKRLELLDQSRVALENFIKKHPSHPSTQKARFQVVQVSAQQGRAQLRQARSLHPNDPGRGPKFVEARRLLNRAEGELTKQLTSFKDKELQLAKLELGKLAIDKIPTYSNDRGRQITIQGQACSRLDDLSNELELTNELKWVATAYAGRAHSLNADGKKAKERFDAALRSNSVEARRLAGYFLILDLYSQIDGKEGLDVKTLSEALKQTIAWLQLYGGAASPERYGVWYVQGYIQFNYGLTAKNDKYIQLAKANFSKVEQFENDFTGLAVDQKIKLMAASGTFGRKLDVVLKNANEPFEDLYYRTLFEHERLNNLIAKDGKIPADKQAEHDQAKIEQRENVIALLNKAITRAEGRQVIERNLNQARFMRTGYHLSLSDSLLTESLELQKQAKEAEDMMKEKEAQTKYTEALAKLEASATQRRKVLETGENFMDKAPEASQASNAAYYAASSLNLLISDYNALLLELVDKSALPGADKEAKGKALVEQQKADLAKRVQLSEKLLKAFPDHPAGKLGQHYWVLHLIESNQGDVATKNFPSDLTFYLVGKQKYDQNNRLEAIELLEQVTPKYPDYAMAQFYVANTCLKLNQDMQKLPGGKDPRARAIEIFMKLPKPKADANWPTNYFYAQGKVTLIGLLFQDKKYPEQLKEGTNLLNLLAQGGFTIGANPDADAQQKKAFRDRVVEYAVYVDYYQIKEAYDKADHKKVIQLVDPLMKELAGTEQTPKKEYVLAKKSMLNYFMQTTFLANIQLAQAAEAQKVFEQWKTLYKQATGQELNVTNLLQQVIGIMKNQMELLAKQGDQKKLQATKENFTAFLTGLQKDVVKDPTLCRYVALSYESISRFQNAIDLLENLLKNMQGVKEWKPIFEMAAPTDKGKNLFRLMTHVRPEFEKQGKKLSGRAKVTAEKSGTEWEIKDPKGPYHLALKGTKLEIAERDPEYVTYMNLKLLLVRQYRLLGESDKAKHKDKIQEAYKRIGEYVKAREKDLLGNKEEIRVLIAMEYYGSAVNKAYALVKALKPFLNNPKVRPHYFDIYFDLIRAYYFYASTQGGDKQQKAVVATANLYVKLERILEVEVSDPVERKTTQERFGKFIKEHGDLSVAVEKAR